jgi:hypothetical protein
VVGLEQQLDFGFRANRIGRDLDHLRLVRRPGDLGQRQRAAAAPADRGGKIGGLVQAILGKILRIDVTDGAAVDDAQAGSVVVAGIDPLDPAFLDADRLVALALDEELHEVGAGAQGALDDAVNEGWLDQGRRQRRPIRRLWHSCGGRRSRG